MAVFLKALDEVVNGKPPKVNYAGVRVRKAWGFEYQLFANEHCAVWHLTIRAGQRTSLHCHPNKKTGLVVLKGVAQVSMGISGGSQHLTPGEKLMIRAGCWHGTKNIGTPCWQCQACEYQWHGGIEEVEKAAKEGRRCCPNQRMHLKNGEDLEVLEVETPNDKSDLVRLEDDYGRAGKPYEGQEAMEPFEAPGIDNGYYTKMGDCELTVEYWKGNREGTFGKDSKVVFLDGGVRDHLTGHPVLGPGDVISAKSLAVVVAKFSPLPSTVLEVRVAT